MRNIAKGMIAAVLVAIALSGCEVPADNGTTHAEEVIADKATKAKGETKKEKAKPDFTTAQEQAIGSATDYLDYSSFSRKGLIEQLEFEDFSTKDATFAVNHIKVNWNKQAAAKAEEYLDTSSFSRQGLIDQLTFEGFTPKQAAYGVSQTGL